ncbi:MAG: hypothetical protein F6K39_15975 [Okeania sp. SIO3B3]|nr:hypothetical protein [Okeania sp. SIO3B3]
MTFKPPFVGANGIRPPLKAEGRRQKAEGRRKKEEGRRKKEEGRRKNLTLSDF